MVISYGRSSRLVPTSHPCVGADVMTGADGSSTWWRLSDLWATETAMREDMAADNVPGDVALVLLPVAEADRLRAIERELGDLARLALHATRRDVEMFVHRLAYRHRGTSLGDALAAQDVVPAVDLRSEGGAS